MSTMVSIGKFDYLNEPQSDTFNPKIESDKEKRNWMIHMLYIRHDYVECLKVIEEQLQSCQGLCEYAIYVKALILRQKGKIQDSLSLFQATVMLNSNNPANLKQVGRSYFLLGRVSEAIECFDEAQKLSPEDWEIWFNKGLCFGSAKQYDVAEDCLIRSNSIQRHDATYIELGKIYIQQEKFREAIDIYIEALDYSPENSELLTTVGLLYLRVGDNFKAFEYLGNSLTHDPKNPKIPPDLIIQTILATGSIIQDHSENDVALSKYRIAAVHTPNSAQLWNNIGMCFFGKVNYVAAIACLKRALYLAPFEWIIAYNLGLVHLNTGQYASAFHYFSASINLKPDFASSYMYLAITLSRLDDFDNACTAYEKAIEMESDHMFELNYAITLYNHDDFDSARHHLLQFERLFSELDEEEREAEQNVLETRQRLSAALA
ncbi:Bardet-Biedl syndrome 4 protein [Acrasis kona]|uniref:Bardet-Biedl syndrome 4 protein n=1 Tax=Acrasis kona TaxID=1008807 RepID=A0AAW2Z9X7_9EUKA